MPTASCPCPKFIQEQLNSLKKEVSSLEVQLETVNRNKNVKKAVGPTKVDKLPKAKSFKESGPKKISIDKRKPRLTKGKEEKEKSGCGKGCCECHCEPFAIESKAGSCVGQVYTRVCGPNHVHHTIKIPCSAVSAKTWGEILTQGPKRNQCSQTQAEPRAAHKKNIGDTRGSSQETRYSNNIQQNQAEKKRSVNQETQVTNRTPKTQIGEAREHTGMVRGSKDRGTQFGVRRESFDQASQAGNTRGSRNQETQVHRDSQSRQTQANGNLSSIVTTKEKETAVDSSRRGAVAETVGMMQKEIRNAKDEKEAALREAARKSLIVDKLKVLLEANAAIVRHQARSVSMLQKQIEERLDAERKDAAAIILDSAVDEMMYLANRSQSKPKLIEEALHDLSRMADECLKEGEATRLRLMTSQSPKEKSFRRNLTTPSGSSMPLQHSSPNPSRKSVSESLSSWEEISVIFES